MNYEKNLGRVATDLVSGFKGTIVLVTSYLHGQDRVSLQPVVDKDGKLPEACDFDTATLKLEKELKVKPTKFNKTKIKHGQKAIDPITEYEGTVIGIGHYINGCRRIGIMRKVQANKDNKFENAKWFDEPQIKIVEKKVIQKRKILTGGPSKYHDDRKY